MKFFGVNCIFSKYVWDKVGYLIIINVYGIVENNKYSYFKGIYLGGGVYKMCYLIIGYILYYDLINFYGESRLDILVG